MYLMINDDLRRENYENEQYLINLRLLTLWILVSFM